MEPGCFDVVLLVDNREVIGGGAGGKESRKQVTASELQALNVGLSTELIGSLKLGKVWVFLQLIHRPTRTKNQLY